MPRRRWDAPTGSVRSNPASRRTSSSATCPTIATSSTTSESTMPASSSSAERWSTLLELPRAVENVFRRDDDPRLADITLLWRGDPSVLVPGRPVLVGFPQDEGVRRNGGRAGAAEAPAEVRRWLSPLTTWDASTDSDLSLLPPLDLGNVRHAGTLEESQQALGEVVAALLAHGTVPVVLGGGHETAFGHYLG